MIFDPTKLSSILEDNVKRLVAWLDFVPKYPPEFNFIDIYWGYSKRKVRTECDHEWESLLLQLPEALDSVALLFIRRALKKCCRYIDDYRIGIND